MEQNNLNHFNLLKVKSELDILLTKMEQDELLQKYISEVREGKSYSDLHHHSFKYDNDIKLIFPSYLTTHTGYFIIRELYDVPMM